jgi:cobyrinic acid a,c-diamide synthase
MTARGLIIAAPRSGSGKTTITLALLAALTRRGVAVRAAKAGPDYIDGAFHAAASGHAVMNLDSWAMPPRLLDALLARSAEGAEILLIEGVMGLFDGTPAVRGRCGSTADLAARFRLPVVLVVDVTGLSQSAAALVRGFATHDGAVRISAVVLNRVASERHRQLVVEAIADLGIPVAGAVPREDGLSLPERHLGLMQAAEHGDLPMRLACLADIAERHLDLDALIAAAAPLKLQRENAPASGINPLTPPALRSGDPLPQGERVIERVARYSPSPDAGVGPTAMQRPHCPLPLWERVPSRNSGEADEGADGDADQMNRVLPLRPPGQRIALAKDRAFSFVYPHVLEGWRRAGAEIVCFSPLADESPPESCDCCWLPGGYPELHAGQLASAHRFRGGLARFARSRSVHGECGGYMVLGQGLEDAGGERHAMAGLLGHATSFAACKLHLGYRQVRLLRDGPLGAAGSMVRGHEFHYASLAMAGDDEPFCDLADSQRQPLGLSGGRRGNVSGTFFHAMAQA